MAEVSAHTAVTVKKNAPGRSGRRSRQRKGEAQQATAAGLDLLRVLGWLVLHDVAIPSADDRGIDHILVGPSGVYVVATVAWSGQISVTEHALVVGGDDRADDLAAVIADADVVREMLGGIPVLPMLCFERLETITGVVAGVALCASENILDVLTSQPELLDSRAIGQASRALTDGIGSVPLAPRPVALAPVPLEPIVLPPAVVAPEVPVVPEPDLRVPVVPEPGLRSQWFPSRWFPSRWLSSRWLSSRWLCRHLLPTRPCRSRRSRG